MGYLKKQVTTHWVDATGKRVPKGTRNAKKEQTKKIILTEIISTKDFCDKKFFCDKSQKFSANDVQVWNI